MATNWDQMMLALKAAGESTRLRILALLAGSDLTVKDLTIILGQSQPRVSRHLKLLAEAGLVQRCPEGAWVYYRLADRGACAELVQLVLDRVHGDDPVRVKDQVRLTGVKEQHAQQAADYFSRHAAQWDRLRNLHVADQAVEAEILSLIGQSRVEDYLDLGTGTGRLLELLADHYTRAVGVDLSHDMLTVARANLAKAGLAHAHVRHGDIHDPSVGSDRFDLITIHQVLHYLDDPFRALEEAAGLLRPGGRLLIVDFAPHDLEFLREEHAHRRLGFAEDVMEQWIERAGLMPGSVRTLAPDAGDADEAPGLTVTLWMAHDPRIQLATDQPEQNRDVETVA